MAQWVIDRLVGNRIQRGASPAQHVVKGGLDTLVRETLQNSKDQQAKDKPVRVLYTLLELSGKAKQEFLAEAGWATLKRHLEAATSDAGGTALRLRRGIGAVDEDQPLRCLRIEDFGTKGLEGGDFDRGKNFNLLCRAEFKTSNVGGRGGSYGLGKAVLWKFSEIGTVLLSSRVLGEEKRGVRIFGRADMPSHIIGDEEYDSGGYFGQRKVFENSPRAESVWGDEELARSLMLGREYSKDTGTSALVLGFHEPEEDESRPLDEIAKSIIASSERWFWPSMSGDHPTLQVRVTVERQGKKTFTAEANPVQNWHPFIQARRNSVTGEKARAPDEISEASISFRVPQRELPPDQQHPSFEATLQLRVARGGEEAAAHEKANCVAVFRGPEMVVKYVALRKPIDDLPFFAVLMAGRATGSTQEDDRAEEFFRATEPPLHNDWEYTEAVRSSYKRGAKQSLQGLWASLQDKVFGLIDENVTPKEEGPQLLAKLFPLGQAVQGKGKKHVLTTKILSSSYLGGKWQIKGEVSRAEAATKSWEARIGFMAQTDSGPGEYLSFSSLKTNKKAAKATMLGPPATVTADPSIVAFEFDAILEPPESLNDRDLDLTAIRLSSGEPQP
jgi:hypothetical protein